MQNPAYTRFYGGAVTTAHMETQITFGPEEEEEEKSEYDEVDGEGEEEVSDDAELQEDGEGGDEDTSPLSHV